MLDSDRAVLWLEAKGQPGAGGSLDSGWRPKDSQVLEGVWFGDHRISSLIFADDVVLLAPSSLDLQHALGHFAAECEAAGMRVSTSKSEAMVLDTLLTLLSLPRKVYSRVLERRVRPLVEPWIQEEQCSFRPSRGTLDQLYILHRVLEGVCPTSPHVFCGLGEGFRPCPLWHSVGDDVVLLAPSSLDLQHALGHFAAECEAAGMRVSTSKSEAMVLDWKMVACTLQVGGEVLPQVEEFKYLWVLFTSEGRMDREIDRRIGAAAAVMRSMYRSVVVKKELSRKAKLLIYQSIYVPTLTYGHELWVMTERVRSRIQAAEMSFLRRVAGRSLRDRVRSSVTQEELGVEPLLLHIERRQLRWLGHLLRMPPGRLPGEVFRACLTGKRPRERPSTRWRDYVSRLAWERIGVPEEVSGEKE
ncbi:hypothetical protein QTP70_022839, partial [Hemibagrus guttatus]